MRALALLPLLALACTAKTDVDSGEASSCPRYEDADGDGHGNSESVMWVPCDEDPSGWARSRGDCDDREPTVYPGAPEICDDLDNDCDGYVDGADPSLDLSSAPTWYPDQDGDGWGDASQGTQACEAPAGMQAEGGDCDDGDRSVNPDAPEICDDIDNDCDGLTDEDDALDAPTWYGDLDGDGYGDPATELRACTLPDDASEDASDCDDSDPRVHPGAPELCDGIDNDCDGFTDEDDAVDALTWYADTDGDGYGDPASTAAACARPEGHVAEPNDCDDSRDDVYPAAPERCDGVDNDCDLFVDEDAVDAPTWYADTDGDGYGDPGVAALYCEATAGWVEPSLATDCDDGDAAIHPSATEVCDGADNDCDALVDDDDPGLDTGTAATWYADGDRDGYGDPGDAALACVAPSGRVDDDGDCDDGDGAIHPGATEICDELDNDCDGLVDDDDPSLDTSTGSAWYSDADGDGYGDPGALTMACDAPSGSVAASMATDCDDGDASSHPAATEVCDGADNDCDGLVDDDDPSLDAGTTTTWYADADSDGYGGGTVAAQSCAQPSGSAASAADCDDGDGMINPGAAELCDGVDNDCDGLVDDDDGDVVGGSTWYADADLDGYGDPDDAITACSEPWGWVADDSDCDDGDDDVNPDASETCDGEDDDCDGFVDDSAGCPCAVETYGGHGYMFCTGTATWDTADRRYQGYGYLLVTINDSAEQAWLTSTAASYGTSKSWWMGANDRGSEGSWVWDSGQAWTYSNWSSGQPDNGSYSEDCGNFSPWGTGQWNDEQCWTYLYSAYEAH
jgi:hypothetical protein